MPEADNEIAAALVRNRDGAPVAVKLGARLPQARLRRVIAHIDANLGRPIAVRELAEIARMSPSHFTALFRRSTGLTPHAYVMNRRMDRARDMIADESLSLAEIAGRLGFSSQAHFTTAFRGRFGRTPSACRARWRVLQVRSADRYRRKSADFENSRPTRTSIGA